MNVAWLLLLPVKMLKFVCTQIINAVEGRPDNVYRLPVLVQDQMTQTELSLMTNWSTPLNGLDPHREYIVIPKPASKKAPPTLPSAPPPKPMPQAPTIAKSSSEGTTIAFDQTGCPLCDGPMTLKHARMGGTFYGCPKWPECRGQRSMGWVPGPVDLVRMRSQEERNHRAMLMGKSADWKYKRSE